VSDEKSGSEDEKRRDEIGSGSSVAVDGVQKVRSPLRQSSGWMHGSCGGRGKGPLLVGRFGGGGGGCRDQIGLSLGKP
jgi:hypothetical protein